MHRASTFVRMTLLLSISTVRGGQQVYISGQSLRTSSSDPLAIGTTTYSAILASLLGQRPPKPLDAQRSAEVGLGLQYHKRVP